MWQCVAFHQASAEVVSHSQSGDTFWRAAVLKGPHDSCYLSCIPHGNGVLLLGFRESCELPRTLFRHSHGDKAPARRSLAPSASAYLKKLNNSDRRLRPSGSRLICDFPRGVPGVFVTGKLTKGGSVAAWTKAVGRDRTAPLCCCGEALWSL